MHRYRTLRWCCSKAWLSLLHYWVSYISAYHFVTLFDDLKELYISHLRELQISILLFYNVTLLFLLHCWVMLQLCASFWYSVWWCKSAAHRYLILWWCCSKASLSLLHFKWCYISAHDFVALFDDLKEVHISPLIELHISILLFGDVTIIHHYSFLPCRVMLQLCASFCRTGRWC